MKSNRTCVTAAIGLAAVLLTSFIACGNDNNINDPDPTALDTIPPASITDLAVYHRFPESISIIWTAPGDDGMEGRASQYDLRYSRHPISEQTWGTAVQWPDEPPPKQPGLRQSMLVYDLESSTDYYFAIKTIDDASNVSALSNRILGRTLPEDDPPASSPDLRSITLDETSIMLIWTVQGDDDTLGQASQYDIRYAEGAFGPLDWETAILARDLPAPKSPGEKDTVIVSGLLPDTNYRFALKTGDEVPNWSEISNVARALSFGEVLAISDRVFTPGDSMMIVFKATAEDKCTLRIKQSSSANCDPSWGFNKILLQALLPAGNYIYIYDFYNEDTGTYEPPYGFVVLCWGSTYMAGRSFSIQ
jgi:hypothetical protein